MKYVGAHVSIEGGVFNAPKNATAIGAKAFALFTKNQRQWFTKPYSSEDIEKFKSELKKSDIEAKHVLPHDSYLINLGHPEEKKRDLALTAFIDEIERCMQLGLVQLNFHPGFHLGLISEEECLENIARCLNLALAKTSGVTLIIENTAGAGSAVGYKFEHLQKIIKTVDDKSRIGVCIDTCHLFVAGYDIRDKFSYKKTWDEFAEIVNFQYLHGMHLNDAKSELASHIDRHQSIGQGNIGTEFFSLLMNDPRMDDIPLILETIDPTIWPEEIKWLYACQK